MTTSVKRKSTLRKLARPEFLILALGVAVCFLGFDSPRQFLKKALFYLNPRYYPDWTRSLLALALIWTILDLGARAAFLNARRKRTRAAAKDEGADGDLFRLCSVFHTGTSVIVWAMPQADCAVLP